MPTISTQLYIYTFKIKDGKTKAHFLTTFFENTDIMVYYFTIFQKLSYNN